MRHEALKTALVAGLLVLGLMVGEVSAQAGNQGRCMRGGGDGIARGASVEQGANTTGVVRRGDRNGPGRARPGAKPPEILNAMGFALEAQATMTTTAGVHVLSIRVASAPPQGTSTSGSVDEVGRSGGVRSDTGSSSPLVGRAFVAGGDYILTDIEIQQDAGGAAPRAMSANLVALEEGPDSSGELPPSSKPPEVSFARCAGRDASVGTSGVTSGSAGSVSIRVDPLEGREIVTGTVVIGNTSYLVLATIQHDLPGGGGMHGPPDRGSVAGQNGGQDPGSSSGGVGRCRNRGGFVPRNGAQGTGGRATRGGEVQSQF
jgi:hypothetical protein